MAKNKSYWGAVLTWFFQYILDSLEYLKENPFPKRSDFEEAKPKSTENSERNSEARNGELHVEGMEREQ
jgi:hypothetical protein